MPCSLAPSEAAAGLKKRSLLEQLSPLPSGQWGESRGSEATERVSATSHGKGGAFVSLSSSLNVHLSSKRRNQSTSFISSYSTKSISIFRVKIKPSLYSVYMGRIKLVPFLMKNAINALGK